MNKPYLLTVASFTNGVKRFADSLKHIDGQVDHLSVQFDPPIEYFPAYKTYPEKYCGNLNRFQYTPPIDDNRFVIFSDTDDVVFQRALPDLERMPYEVYLASENVKHNESFWKPFIERSPELKELGPRNVFNAGLFAMRGRIFKKLQFFMKDNLKWIAEADQPISDQLLFNLFFSRNPFYDIYTGLDIFCPLYRNLELKQVVVRKGLFILSDGHVPVAVHGNGNTKEVLDDGRKINKFAKKA